MSSFSIDASLEEGVTVLTCVGRLDNNATSAFDACMTPRLAQGEKNFALDLSGVDYLSSAGLRSLLLALKKTNLAGGILTVFGATAFVLQVLELSGFQAILKIHPDRASAVAAARKNS